MESLQSEKRKVKNMSEIKTNKRERKEEKPRKRKE
jgi:hypothetical protein